VIVTVTACLFTAWPCSWMGQHHPGWLWWHLWVEGRWVMSHHVCRWCRRKSIFLSRVDKRWLVTGV